MFQSAPLTDVRGDIRSDDFTFENLRFQSAPLTDVRGDNAAGRGIERQQVVSIRSPHGCKGRSLLREARLRIHQFQSAPLTDVRGDLDCLGGIVDLHSFNPLPSRM